MKLTHVTIQTSAFEQEIDFYLKYLHFEVMNDLRPFGKHIVFLAEKEDDTKIEIIQTEKAGSAGNEKLSIGFEVNDAEAVRDVLIKDGYQPTPMIEPMPGVHFFFVQDPAGVNVQFICQ